MIRYSDFLTHLQEGVYVAEKSPDHQNVSVRAPFLKDSQTWRLTPDPWTHPRPPHGPSLSARRRPARRRVDEQRVIGIGGNWVLTPFPLLTKSFPPNDRLYRVAFKAQAAMTTSDPPTRADGSGTKESGRDLGPTCDFSGDSQAPCFRRRVALRLRTAIRRVHFGAAVAGFCWVKPSVIAAFGLLP